MDDTLAFYSRPSHQFGGGAFPVFTGSRRQRGGSIFGSLKRFFVPIAKSVGRNLLNKGLGLARDVAEDALAGKNIKSSIVNRGKAAAIDVGKSTAKQGLNAISKLIGSGKRRRRRRRRLQQRRHSLRKRKARSKSCKRRTKRRRSKSCKRRVKRRRTNF